jgi:hypothetical protein
LTLVIFLILDVLCSVCSTVLNYTFVSQMALNWFVQCYRLQFGKQLSNVASVLRVLSVFDGEHWEDNALK